MTCVMGLAFRGEVIIVMRERNREKNCASTSRRNEKKEKKRFAGKGYKRFSSGFRTKFVRYDISCVIGNVRLLL